MTNVLGIDRRHTSKRQPSLPPPAKFDPGLAYYATLHTRLGVFTLQLFGDMLHSFLH